MVCGSQEVVNFRRLKWSSQRQWCGVEQVLLGCKVLHCQAGLSNLVVICIDFGW